MASIPKGIQNVNSILPKIWAIMALSRHTDASYIPPFHRTVTRKLTRTQNYYFLGGAVCVTGLYPFYLGKTSNCTQICWHHLQNPVSELTTCFKEPRWQESEAAWGEFHGIRQKHYCQNHGNVTTTFQECFVLPVNKVRQKEEKKKKKKIAAQKQSSLSLKDRKHIPTWNETTDVITARTQLTKEGTIPRQFPIIHPHHSAQLFTSSALLHTPLIW